MEYHPKSRYVTPDPNGKAWHALTASGVWMRIGFIGASASASGLVLASQGGASVLTLVALVLGGGLVATLAWRRARAVLERADAWDAPAASAASIAGTTPRYALRRAAILGIE